MRSFLYTNQTTSDAVKLVGENVQVRYRFTGATDLICYVKAGLTNADMDEITDSTGATVTRYTATGTGTQIINIAGLTPGSWVAIGTVSGTGTLIADILTGTGV